VTPFTLGTQKSCFPPGPVTHRGEEGFLDALRIGVGGEAGRAGELPQPDLRPAPGAPFEGLVRTGMCDDLRWCHVRSSAHVLVQRPPPFEDPDGHFVVLQLYGSCSFTTGGAAATLRPGGVLLALGGETLRVESARDSEVLLLPAPFTRSQLACLPAGRMKGGDARESLHWARQCSQREGRVATQRAAQAAQALLRQLRDALCGQAPAPRRGTVTRADIEAYVLQHLTDRSLSPSSIAEALGCSVRTLHRAFHREGDGEVETLERHLGAARARHCAELLSRPDLSHVSITALALECGFSSPGHCSTVFREHFGVSPSVYRREEALHVA
jgi:AraC-like DNA-binding protein